MGRSKPTAQCNPHTFPHSNLQTRTACNWKKISQCSYVVAPLRPCRKFWAEVVPFTPHWQTRHDQHNRHAIGWPTTGPIFGVPSLSRKKKKWCA